MHGIPNAKRLEIDELQVSWDDGTWELVHKPSGFMDSHMNFISFILKSYHNDIKYHVTLNTLVSVIKTWLPQRVSFVHLKWVQSKLSCGFLCWFRDQFVQNLKVYLHALTKLYTFSPWVIVVGIHLKAVGVYIVFLLNECSPGPLPTCLLEPKNCRWILLATLCMKLWMCRSYKFVMLLASCNQLGFTVYNFSALRCFEAIILFLSQHLWRNYIPKLQWRYLQYTGIPNPAESNNRIFYYERCGFGLSIINI